MYQQALDDDCHAIVDVATCGQFSSSSRRCRYASGSVRLQLLNGSFETEVYLLDETLDSIVAKINPFLFGIKKSYSYLCTQNGRSCRMTSNTHNYEGNVNLEKIGIINICYSNYSLSIYLKYYNLLKMEQNYIKAINLCKGAYKDCCKRTNNVLRHTDEVFRLSKKEEYTPLYDANFLEIANPYEPKTSKMIEAILKYKQDGEFILFKSFARKFLCPLGFNEKWIENPDIHAEKEHMDICILDKEKKQYAVFFENKLKGAPFQRNQKQDIFKS